MKSTLIDHHIKRSVTKDMEYDHSKSIANKTAGDKSSIQLVGQI